MDHVSDSPISVDLGRIAQDLQIRRIQVETVVQLLDEANAVPYIARYCRERTGGLPEGLIREIQSRVARARDLTARKQAILKTIEGQGRLTEELATAIRATENSRKLDDLYLPYKPRKRTKGIEAREQGLEPLALRIWDRDESLTDLNAAATELVNAEKGLDTPEKVLEGVRHILAESIGDLAHVREALRRTVWKLGRLATSKSESVPEGKGLDYRDYFQYAEPVGHVPAHRTLAINRGEKEGVLKVKLDVPRGELERTVLAQLPLEDHPHKEIFTAATLDSLERILMPAMEREVKRELGEVAERHAVEVFARNLRSLLLQPPISDKVVLAIDPGRKGCKLAVLDGEGKLLEHAIVHPFPIPIRRYEAKQKIKELVATHHVELVAIGNGTACRETEELIAELIAEGSHFHNNPGEPFPGAPAHVKATEASNGDDGSASAKEESESTTAVTEEMSGGDESGGEAESPEASHAQDPETAAVEETAPAVAENGQFGETGVEESKSEEVVTTTPPSAIDPENLPPISGGSGLDDQPEPEIESESQTEVTESEVKPEGVDLTPEPLSGDSGFVETVAEVVHQEVAWAETPDDGVIATAHTASVLAEGDEAGANDEVTQTISSSTETIEGETGAVPPTVESTTPLPRIAPALTHPPKGSTKPKTKVEREPRPPKPKTPPPPPSPHAADRLLSGLAYLIVNEAGANVYSASSLAKEELPEHDAELRGTISIGRRLQDPLAELVKVDPQNIGVGQYQHDVNPKHLKESLDQVVESCVNFVGVDVNRSGVTLLARVSGLNEVLARRIVDYRKEHGPFRSRDDLKQVEGITDSVWSQASGFLKVRESENPLDRTWVHPTQYQHAVKLLETLELTPAALLDGETLATVHTKFNELDVPTQAESLGLTPPALVEIMEALALAERDPREDSPKPIFKRGLLKLEDLESGTELMGTVLNVVDFGAFVDIGLKDSGLVHISQLANRYVKSPHDVVSVGDVVTVWVMTVDKDRKRVSLTMIQPGTERPRPERGPRGGGGGGGGEGGGPGGPGGRRGPRPQRRAEGGSGPGAGGGGRGASGESGAGGAAAAAPRPSSGGRIPGPPLRMQQGRGGRPGQRGGMGGRGGPGRPQGGAPRPDVGATGDAASAASKPKPKPTGPVPLPSEAVAGNSPLRSFGQLKQLFELRQKGPEEEAAEQAAFEREQAGMAERSQTDSASESSATNEASADSGDQTNEAPPG